MPTYIDASGQQVDLKLSPVVYKMAAEKGLSVPEFVNQSYPTAEGGASTFEQLCASSGLVVNPDRTYGLKSPTLASIYTGQAELASNVLDANPASRLLYPAVVLELIENKPEEDRALDPDNFDRMIAIDSSVSSNRTEQPIVNFSNAEAAKAKLITQLAAPSAMLTITTSDTARQIPTMSLGVEVSDQALAATTMDFVSKAVARWRDVERKQRMYGYLSGFVDGDLDLGQAALAQTKANTLDTGIVAAGAVTKKALILWLYTNYYKRRINWVVTDVAVMMAIEAVLTNSNTNVPGVAGFPQLSFSVVNRMLENINFFVIDPSFSWTANTILGFDSRSAIHRMRNSAAAYSAMETFVMRRSNQLRFDFAEIAYRLYDDAFSVLSLTL